MTLRKSRPTSAPGSLLFVLAIFVGALGVVAFSPSTSVVSAQNVPDLEQLDSFTFPFENVDLRPVVTAVVASPDKKTLYVGGDDRRVYSWAVDSKEIVAKFGEFDDWVRDVAFSPTVAELATLTQSGELKIWNPDSNSDVPLRAAKEKIVGARAFAYSPNGKVIAVCGYEPEICLFDAATLKLLTVWRAPGQSSTTVRFSSDGTYFAVGGRDGIVRVWTTENGKSVQNFETAGKRRVRALAFSPDGTSLATAGDGPEIEIWNVATGQKTADLPIASGKIFAITFCGNDKIATGDSLNVVQLWDVAARRPIAQGVAHTGTIAVLQFDPTDSTILSGGFDTTVIKWQIP